MCCQASKLLISSYNFQNIDKFQSFDQKYPMQGEKKMLAVVVEKYGDLPIVIEKPVPAKKQGEILIHLEASTINPSDRIFLKGQYFKLPLPTTAGFEGVGKVLEGPNVGKRVSFLGGSGSWAEYITTSIWFEVDDDVPVASAASGIVNPLTVLGFIDVFRKNKHSGIIHTAAASALGRMLNKICQTEKIPLLNIVRRKEQAELLKKEGAEHVIVTEGDWENSYQEFLKTHKFDAYFDALGGGAITEKLIAGLQLPATVYVYGVLTGEKLTVPASSMFFAGLQVKGFLLRPWWATLTEQEQNAIRNNYSKYLKGELSTQTGKQFTFAEIKEALEHSEKHATGGKVLLTPK